MALPEEINNNKLREIKIYRLISNDEEDINFKKERDDSTLSIELPLLPR